MKRIEITHPHAAGINIGSRDFYVAADTENIRVFSTSTEDSEALCNYLKSEGVTTVAMVFKPGLVYLSCLKLII